ncbi:hypothetical protein CW735_15650 [Alteromonas sp. MB-3u-76]|uniref:hypothetical protein n=1 Tax=Alteromonas sp. MB-3u-76 TaxID=2058133 RepID=UPI000C30474B|nr:hypothetical protein [Alteromonas sp. MB-3u-76]AUC89445.1 hypothetical protein CW735_15650 [Alteromonas sp. MB-3u-76]
METLVQSELKQLLEHYCNKRKDFEQRHAQYDIRESMIAVGMFAEIAKTVDYNADMAHYSKLLEEKVKDYKSSYPTHLKGEYSGGYATMGSCLIDFLGILENLPNFDAAIDYINAKYNEDNVVMIKGDDIVYLEQQHPEAPLSWQRSLLKNVLIVIGVFVYFVVLMIVLGSWFGK